MMPLWYPVAIAVIVANPLGPVINGIITCLLAASAFGLGSVMSRLELLDRLVKYNTITPKDPKVPESGVTGYLIPKGDEFVYQNTFSADKNGTLPPGAIVIIHGRASGPAHKMAGWLFPLECVTPFFYGVIGCGLVIVVQGLSLIWNYCYDVNDN